MEPILHKHQEIAIYKMTINMVSAQKSPEGMIVFRGAGKGPGAQALLKECCESSELGRELELQWRGGRNREQETVCENSG